MSTNPRTADEPLDCDEGCDERSHKHKWEIEPHPYDSDFDVLVTDDDDDAAEAIREAAEQAWDQCEEGGEMIVKIRRNKVQS
jgi:DNA-directed RNA polymerase subunit L